MPAGRPTSKKAPDFGRRLSILRKERGWTQPQLAELLGVSVKSINYYEREAKNPTSKTIERIAEILAVTPAELMNGISPSSPKRKSGPPSRLEKIFAQVSALPRSKQQLIADMLEGYLEKAS